MDYFIKCKRDAARWDSPQERGCEPSIVTSHSFPHIDLFQSVTYACACGEMEKLEIGGGEEKKNEKDRDKPVYRCGSEGDCVCMRDRMTSCGYVSDVAATWDESQVPLDGKRKKYKTKDILKRIMGEKGRTLEAEEAMKISKGVRFSIALRP